MGCVRFLPLRQTVAGRTPGALSALCAFTLLMLEASPAAGAVGTLGEGIAAYDRGDYPLAFEILDDIALDSHELSSLPDVSTIDAEPTRVAPTTASEPAESPTWRPLHTDVQVPRSTGRCESGPSHLVQLTCRRPR